METNKNKEEQLAPDFWLRAYSKETKKLILRDIRRFSKLHAWFRYLPLEGKEYLIFPWKGEQPKNAIDHDIKDKNGIHWWIWDSAFIDEMPINGYGKEIIMKYRITLNCFFRGVEINERDGIEYEKGWSVIANKYPRVGDIMERRYPNIESKTLYFKFEQKKQIREAISASKKILSLMQERCPIWLTEVQSIHTVNVLPRSRKYSLLSSIAAPNISGETSSIDSGTMTQSSSVSGKSGDGERAIAIKSGVDTGRGLHTGLFRAADRRFRRTQSDFSLIARKGNKNLSMSNKYGADAYEIRNMHPRTEFASKAIVHADSSPHEDPVQTANESSAEEVRADVESSSEDTQHQEPAKHKFHIHSLFSRKRGERRKK